MNDSRIQAVPEESRETSPTKSRLLQLLDTEARTVRIMISNEHLWELGYTGSEPNPHSGNIAIYMQYLDALERLKEQAKMMDM